MGSSSDSGSQLGDTTYTKIFIGGLAWATQRDSISRYFERFGEIYEAVVIFDKRTGRSKGYGFVNQSHFSYISLANQYPILYMYIFKCLVYCSHLDYRENLCYKY